jgi:nucleotide-binding universal stress UspA family protein
MMIVMGTHGRRGLAHLFLGSVAEKVIRKSAVPVLTVRALEGASPPAAS